MARPTAVTPRTAGRASYGPATAELAESLGQPFIPWQDETSQVSLEVGDNGRQAFRTVIITGPRQIGKTVLVKAVNTKKIAMGRRVFTTAQTRKKAARRWADGTAGVELALNGTRRQRRTITADMVVKRTSGNDYEQLEWLSSGGIWEPFAPNEDGMHGESPDDVHVDECMAFTAEEAEVIQAGYKPAQSARPDPQEWLTSTQGNERAIWWATVCAAGRESAELGLTSGIYYREHSIPRVVDGVSVYDLPHDVLLDVIFHHHPGDGYLLNRDQVADDLRAVEQGRASLHEFIRAYGNLQIGGDAAGAWPTATWNNAGTDLAPVGAVGFGVDVDPDGREWALVAAGRSDAGDRVIAEWVAGGSGAPGPAEVAKVAEIVKRQRPTAVYVIGSGASVDFADQLDAAGCATQRISQIDLAAATTRTRKAIEAKRMLHRRQPALDAARKAGLLRSSGERRYWARSGDKPIAPLQAMTMAGWALDHPAAAGPTGPFRMFVPRSA